MSLITCKNLTISYDGRPVISHLSFDIGQGDYLAIVGENGSGKSTLMKALLGLKKPSNGTIVFGDGLKSGGIGYLPQQTPLQKDFPASVREVVLSGCINNMGLRPFYSLKEQNRADSAIKRLDLEHLERCCYRDLSGGQQQRVLLARALCATGSLLMLDEPVTGLDPHISAEMYTLLSQLNAEGLTIIMISHDISAALRYASHILHLGGNEAFFGTKDEYLSHPTGQLFAHEVHA